MATDAPTLQPEQLLEHVEWMRRLARALVREPVEADDLAQEALTVALDAPPATDRPVRPWLAGVMRNLALLRRRGAGRRERREQAVADLAAPAPTPEQLVQRVETQRLVADMVLRLDEPFRSTVLLRYYEGLSAADIARQQGIPAGTVRWRLKRGLDELRGHLDDSFEGDRQRWHALLAPLVPAAVDAATAATGSAAGGLVQGAIAVKTITKIAAIIAALVALFATAYVAGWFGKDSGNAKPVATAPTDDDTTSGAPAPPEVSTRIVTGADGPRLVAATADPKGNLRLEGQVIDDTESPVGGATVAIDARPPRTTTTEADGSFAFDGLAPREYELEARTGKLYAGPLKTTPAADSDPVILRARAGADVIVAVTSAADGKPVAGAEVELRSTLAWHATTDASGEATLSAVGPGWRQLRVYKQGYAPAASIITNGARRATQRIPVRLEAGAAASGRVLTADGAPVAGARVWASATSEPFPVIDPRIDAVTTDPNGAWSIGALPAGTYRFTAAHPDHAETPSDLVTLRDRAVDDIEIRVAAGGVLTGVVTDANGAPMACAGIRLAGHGTVVSWSLHRDATTGDDGQFRLTGLPRREIDVVAHDATGSSHIATVDLVSAPEANVALTIDIAGAVTGVVVDSAGDPVANADVMAAPVFTGNVGERAAWNVRGTPILVADKDGAFRFTGLPTGQYRIKAARPGSSPDALWLHAGVPVEPGAANITVEVREEILVVGKVLYDDGTVPEVFTVSIGDETPTPFASKDGSFAVAGPSGNHNVVVSGPTFVKKFVPDVTIEATGVTDVGTINVERGRSVSGRVLDESGNPVAGASVAAGLLLTGGGSELNIESEGFGVHETSTDERGWFTMTGFDPRPVVVVAQKDPIGRSRSLSIPRGEASVEIDLVLQGTGSLSGVVTRNGKPLAESVVVANPIAATRSNFFVITGADGSYALDMLSEDTYIVMSWIGSGGGRPKDIYMRRAVIERGKHTKADIDIVEGDVTVNVSGVTNAGEPIPIAQVFAASVALNLDMDAPTMEFVRNTLPLEKSATIHVRNMMGGGPVKLERLRAGPYTVCVVPLPVNPLDAAQMQRIAGNAEQLPMECKTLQLEAGSAPLDVSIQVPAEWTVPKD